MLELSKRSNSENGDSAEIRMNDRNQQGLSTEALLLAQLESDPDNADLLQRLCTNMLEQGKQIPLKLEQRTLTAHLKQFPDRADLRARLDQVQFNLGTISRDRCKRRICSAGAARIKPLYPVPVFSTGKLGASIASRAAASIY